MKLNKHIYKWHRNVSVLIAFPILIWALSGFLHPIMTNIRPAIFTQQSPENIIDNNAIKISLSDVLKNNAIQNIDNFRVVRMGENWYYQVKKSPKAIALYFSTSSGELLVGGDSLYAIYLAEQYLNGKQNGSSKVKSACRQTHFTNEYQQVNQLLPVYRVNFDRADGIRIYVDTNQSRFSFAVDNKRAFFNQLFSLLHTWSWLDKLSFLKVILIAALMLLTLTTTTLGLIIFFNTNSSRKRSKNKLRRRHRLTALFASLFTIFWAFSGCVHILSSLRADDRGHNIAHPLISAQNCNIDFGKLDIVIGSPIIDVSIAQMNGQIYLRITEYMATNGSKDLMKQMAVKVPTIQLLKLSDYSLLKDGDERYAKYLASRCFVKKNRGMKATLISAFGYDYNFSDKVLPVWEVHQNQDNGAALYIETATGILRKRASDIGKFDAFCFAVFHKHEFMAWAGKGIKDFSTMFWVTAQIVLIFFGLVLFFKQKKKKIINRQSH